MTELKSSGGVSAAGNMRARDIITGIQKNFNLYFLSPFDPPADLNALRSDYLAHLRDNYQYLDMKGIMQVQQVTQQLPLTAVYVPLKAQGGHNRLENRVAGRLWRGEGELSPEEMELVALERQAVEPRPVEAALKTDPAVVVLGDPGAGKSTLLKVLALALAEQENGPLPILLPLNAYARRLQQGEINLTHYLAEYYAARRKKLRRIGELFNVALSAGQAVILLDGLDEVQANRAHLVRLAQDFVAEYSPPISGPRPPDNDAQPPLQGNRIVVTSRIVGYEEAPLAGKQWRTYTLTDFNRADIEQFVRQWTLAFAVSVQGEGEAAREAAGREERELLEAIFSRPSVERLAANPLLLTILALIKYTGVVLPEQRVKLYELYLQALIESWNRSRALDQYPVGPGINYEETVQVLAPLALWLRQENPTAGLVSKNRLEKWLTGYYHGEEWGLPKGEARQQGREFLRSVEKYSNLLLERGEGQYGFLHLTLEEMLAAKGIIQLTDEDRQAALAIFETYLLDPAWNETLQLAVGVVGVIQQRPKPAGELLKNVLALKTSSGEGGRQVIFAGEALLDVGAGNVSRAAAREVETALAGVMQGTAYCVANRRDAGDLLGRLGWLPAAAEGDITPEWGGQAGLSLDAFRPVPGMKVLMGKYPVTHRQYARFMADKGYERREFWSDAGWAWRAGDYDSKAPAYLQNWLKQRPPEKRNQPFWWDNRQRNSPLYPVVGVSWFEAEAYTRWLTRQFQGERFRLRRWSGGGNKTLPVAPPSPLARLPKEKEWEAAVGGRGDYPWGSEFDKKRLNSNESWSEFEREEIKPGVTAVTTYPQGVSRAGIWDGAGNVWEWVEDWHSTDAKALRGGSWNFTRRDARVSTRLYDVPVDFNLDVGFRVLLASVL